MTLQTPMFVKKTTLLNHPTLLVGVLVTHGKSEEDYTMLSEHLYFNGVKSLLYGTDGEVALGECLKQIPPPPYKCWYKSLVVCNSYAISRATYS